MQTTLTNGRSTLNAVDYSYIVDTDNGDTLDTVVDELIDAIDGVNGFEAIKLNNGLRIIRSGAFTIAYDAPSGENFTGDAAPHEETVFPISGTIIAGEEWSADIDGTPDSYVAGSNGDSLTPLAVATGLRGEIGSGSYVEGTSLVVHGQAGDNVITVISTSTRIRSNGKRPKLERHATSWREMVRQHSRRYACRFSLQHQQACPLW